jgi:uncharacterized protein (TIGR03118 family)
MRLLHNLRRLLPRRPTRRKFPRARLALEALEDRRLLSGGFVQTNLVSDIPDMAQTPDPHLRNPWGLTASATSPFWVSNNNDGTSTLYTGQGAIVPLVVTIPTNTITTPPTLGSPTGTVFNDAGAGTFDLVAGNNKTSSFFLFDTEDGQIDGWAGGNVATVKVTNNNAGYKGLTLGTDMAGDHLLYAANFAQGTIDVFDPNFQIVQGAPGSDAKASPITLKGTFTDPNLPTGFAPFNIQAINGLLYVEYAKFDPTTTEGLPGKGLGFVDVFNGDGQLVNPNGMDHLISRGALDAPWGVALAPANFGQFSNDLLVGNFGDGRINAFNPTTGDFLGTLRLANGQVFQEDDLWSLRFGNGAVGKTGQVLAPTNTLYFTAGLNDQKDGLFGSLQAVPTIHRHASVLGNLAGAPQQTFSTVADSNGDLNPYGVAFVPQGFQGTGMLKPGDLLVSNFNDSSNVQGTGSTIQLITPDGQHSTFFNGSTALPGTPLGLTTALGVLKGGFVLVGNVPTDANGVAQQGSLLILDGNGKVVANLTDAKLLDGPWDLTINDHGDFAQVFVSNVLSGTVTRIDLAVPDGGKPHVLDMVQIASGFAHRTDPNALVVGPTGLAFDAKTDTLFVASTADNAIFAIHHAAITFHDHGTGTAIVQNDPHLHGPLGLVLAPNGDLIVANGDAVNPGGTANDLVEFTRKGKFVADFQLDTGNPGAAFGLAISTDNGEIRFAAVDDNTNTVKVWTFQRSSHRHGMDEGGLSGEARMSDRDAVDNFFADLGKHRGDLD